MNYQEIKAEKENLEVQIARLISEFQKRLELPVSNVDVVMADITNIRTPTYKNFIVARVVVTIQI